ncbi:MAG: arginase family protein [Sporichthyaceae bacterium]|nr:arginase family protein [Sporichthyaceae bacterium]
MDGHEDAWDPHRSPTGEAADSELGLALGHCPDDLPPALAELLPLLEPADVAVLGARDAAELAAAGQPSLADEVVMLPPDRLRAQGMEGATAAVLEPVAARGPWWLHVDLDVLATDQLAAVDYQQDGGLSWVELTAVVTTALSTPGCQGWTLCIYNPDLDPDRSEARNDRGLCR